MAVMNTSVRWMHSGMQGAPVIDNNWGDLTAMLRACCVTGFNVRPIQSITCQGTKATIQCAGHGYVEHQVVQIENATPEGYNGAHRVVSVEGGNTLTIELETELPEAQAMPGQTLQMRTAPLGWESLFDDGGQKLVLRSTDPQSTRNVLRVDDSCPAGYDTRWAKFGRVTMAQGMTDLDTFVGARAPFDPANPTKNEVPQGSGSSVRSGWFKWYYAINSVVRPEREAASNGVRPWVIVGDGRNFYPCLYAGSNPERLVPLHYGDTDSLQPGDAFSSLLCAASNYTGGEVYSHVRGSLASSWSGSEGRLFLRDYLGEGLPVACAPRSLDVRSSTGSSYIYSGYQKLLRFPNGPGNGLLLHPVWMLQDNGHLRSKLRGMFYVLHKQTLGHMAVVDGVSALPRRRALLIDVALDRDEIGSVAFDITGPW